MGRPTSQRQLGAPWGTAPCPLVPLAYRRAYGGTPALWQLAAAAGSPDLSLADLDDVLWERLPWPALPADLFRLLREQIGWFAVPPELGGVPSGVDRAWLLGLPFRTRTLNSITALLRDRQEDGVKLRRSLPAAEILQLRGAGRRTLVDFLCVLEGVQERPSLILLAGAGETASRTGEEVAAELSAAASKANEAGSPVSLSDGTPAVAPPREGARPRRAPEALPEPLLDLLAGAGEVLGARTLQDALLVELPRLSAVAGMERELADIDLATVTGGKSLAGELLGDLEALRSELDRRQTMLLDERFCRRRPKTLQQLGDVMGITRERVRQLETKLRRRLASLPSRAARVLAGAVALRLAPILSTEELDREIETLFAGAAGPEVALACRVVRDALGYKERKAVSMTSETDRLIVDLKAVAKRLADDAGLFEEEALQATLPDNSWQSRWELLVELCGFHRIDGLLGLRASQKARVKAAILRIGRVATKAEIAERCGLTIQRTTSYLSGLEGVVRADRTRWGLSDWIEDAYDGVAGEILQRIDEDGGATRVERLFEELPRLFGTPEATIRAYLGAPQFTVEDGFVRRVDPAALKLRPLDDVVDGRDERQRPFLVFRVEERFMRGHSLAGLPPEIASALGCEPNGGTRVAVRHPEGCGPVSVRWNLAALNGVSMGYLGDPLEKLGAAAGETVRVVLRGSSELEFRLHDGLEVQAHMERPSAADLVERMKMRRKVL